MCREAVKTECQEIGWGIRSHRKDVVCLLLHRQTFRAEGQAATQAPLIALFHANVSLRLCPSVSICRSRSQSVGFRFWLFVSVFVCSCPPTVSVRSSLQICASCSAYYSKQCVAVCAFGTIFYSAPSVPHQCPINAPCSAPRQCPQGFLWEITREAPAGKKFKNN